MPLGVVITKYTPWIFFVLGIFLYIFPVHERFWHCAIIVSVFVFICLCLLQMCLHWFVCVFFTVCSLVALHLGNFVLCLSCEQYILPPRCCFICLWIHMFVHIIQFFTGGFSYFIQYNTWLEYILGVLLCIFPDFLLHCFHPCLPALTIVD